jgi:hypothetical protein
MEEEMERFLSARRALLAVAVALCVLPASAQEEQDPAEVRGREILQRAGARLSALESFSFTSEIEYDVLQDFGQMLEFGATRTVQVRRPDRLHVSALRRDGERSELFFDGRAISFWLADQRFYAQVPFEGTLDGALDHMDQRLDQVAPLAELIHSDLPQMLDEIARSVLLVGEVTLDGVRCHHLAVEGETLDWQIWLSVEDSLPRRVTISYHSEGRPGFRSNVRDWDTEPTLGDAIFAFEPPPGAARIPVVAERSPADEER